ncbi:MAG TPA: zf-HC2 domain-containing protein [Nitrospirota bacterium]|nr:zf-HC2 domain-containing protein [Nitrospirota bacterium]
MTCRNTDIREMLAAYRSQRLDPEDAKRIEGHLAECGECRDELALLRMLSDEAVPDPGEAYWASLPGLIYDQVGKERTAKKPAAFDWSRLLNPFPRWAWASAAAAVVAVVAWFALHPGGGSPVREPSESPGEQTAIYDLPLDDPVDVTDMSTPEITAVTQWADNATAPIGEAIDQVLAEQSDQDFGNELRVLNARELNRLLHKLSQDEREEANGERTNIGKLGIA